MTNKLHLRWIDVMDFATTIINQIKNDYPNNDKPIRVIGVTNGGVIPATLIAKGLNAKLLETVRANGQLYIDDNKLNILVDDIADSGKTIGQLMATLSDFDRERTITATLCKRHNSKYDPNYKVFVIRTDTWIVFPWENGVEK